MASNRKSMWPFARTRRTPAEATPERETLPESQLDGTLRYGWRGADPDDVKEGLRRQLKPSDEAESPTS